MDALVINRTPMLAVISMAVVAVSPVCAQRVLHQWFGTTQTVPTSDLFGLTPFVGDLDGDGVNELLLSSSFLNVGPWTQAGRVTVLSGRTKQVVHDRFGSASGMMLGATPHHWSSSRSVDGDGDKKLDIHIGYVEAGRVVHEVWNGQTFESIDSFQSIQGYQILGDVDGDGIADRIVGRRDATPSPGLVRAGQVVVYSGATGQLIYELWGTRADQGFGARIAAAVDLDGDRVHDFVVVSTSGIHEWTSNNLIQVFSGRSGNEIARIVPTSQTYGSWICATHDLDGDGNADLVMNDKGLRIQSTYGRVHALAGPSFQRVVFDIVRPGTLLTQFGEFFQTCRDVDGDGCDDLVVWSMENSTTLAGSVLSGRDQTVLFHVAQDPRTEWTSMLYPAHGDYDGDEFPDFVVNVPEIVPARRRAELRSGAPDGVDVHGRACFDRFGRTPRIGASYKPEPGRPFHVNLSRVAPGQSAWLMLGASSTIYAGVPLPADLAAIGLRGCDLSVSVDMALAVTTTGVNGIGRAIVPLSIPNDPSLRGGVFHAQWLVLGHGGVGATGTTTRALSITIQ